MNKIGKCYVNCDFHRMYFLILKTRIKNKITWKLLGTWHFKLLFLDSRTKIMLDIYCSLNYEWESKPTWTIKDRNPIYLINNFLNIILKNSSRANGNTGLNAEVRVIAIYFVSWIYHLTNNASSW